MKKIVVINITAFTLFAITAFAGHTDLEVDLTLDPTIVMAATMSKDNPSDLEPYQSTKETSSCVCSKKEEMAYQSKMERREKYANAIADRKARIANLKQSVQLKKARNVSNNAAQALEAAMLKVSAAEASLTYAKLKVEEAEKAEKELITQFNVEEKPIVFDRSTAVKLTPSTK